MAAIQLSFNLRTSANAKSVHLLGSWDNYQGQLPLAKSTEKVGGWKGTFRFQGQTLKQGQRYWYYYIIDGYHVSHDPAQTSTKEPTTGRMLNILDVPAATSTAARSTIAKGRPLSVSKIAHPKPVKPNETRKIINTTEASLHDLEKLASQFEAADLDDESDDDESLVSANASSVGSSVSSRSGSAVSFSSASDVSNCSCERYGITRKGDRVRLDCGGSRCSYSDSDSCCSSDEEEVVAKSPKSTRRQGVVMRRG